MYNPGGDIIQDKLLNVVNRFCIGLLIVVAVFLLSIPCFAYTSTTINQTEMLKIVNNCIEAYNYQQPNGTYITNIKCYPNIFLTAGNCNIEFQLYGHHWISKQEAYDLAVQRYSLTSHKGYYEFEILDSDNYVIRCIMSPDFYTEKYPIPGQAILNGTFLGQQVIGDNYAGYLTKDYVNTCFYIAFPDGAITTLEVKIKAGTDYHKNVQDEINFLRSIGYNVVRWLPHDNSVVNR